jgi:N-acylglucosamine 2-epimerase
MDVEGFDPVQLEWDMKLWWPHCEAMVAYSLLYRHTGEDKYLQKFFEVTDWTLKHFADNEGEHGEWFGYLNRAGERTCRIKGGPYKGCFHVPRALFLSM